MLPNNPRPNRGNLGVLPTELFAEITKHLKASDITALKQTAKSVNEAIDAVKTKVEPAKWPEKMKKYRALLNEMKSCNLTLLQLHHAMQAANAIRPDDKEMIAAYLKAYGEVADMLKNKILKLRQRKVLTVDQDKELTKFCTEVDTTNANHKKTGVIVMNTAAKLATQHMGRIKK